MGVKWVIVFLQVCSAILLDSQRGSGRDIAESVFINVERLLYAFPRLVDFMLKHGILICYRVGVDVLVVLGCLSIFIIMHDKHTLLSWRLLA